MARSMSGWPATRQSDYAKVLASETGLPFGMALTMVHKDSRHVVSIDPPIAQDQQIVLDTFRQAGEIKIKHPLDKLFLII